MSPGLCSFGEEDLLPLALGQPVSDELRSHAATCPACQERLQKLRNEASTLRRAMQGSETAPFHLGAAPAVAPRAPATIGRYFVVGMLGQGSQATAYRALHPELHKELVIKHAREPAGSDGQGLLAREGRLLAELDHPNVARVYDLDVHDGRPFLVMDYIRGVNLDQFVSRQKPTPRQAAALLAQIAEAAGAAHRRGIIHQDIKPGNIVVDEAGKPYLVDFGMARLRHAWSAEADQPGGGTAAYMAPEQARQETDKVGPASDVFALGAVLYFLLTGCPPYPGSDWYEVMQRAGRGEFDRSLLGGKKIPRRLAAICLRAMATQPEDRYARAEDMAGDLQRYLRRPKQFLVIGAAAALLMMVAFGLFYFWPRTGPPAAALPAARQPLVTLIQRAVRGKSSLFTPSNPSELARQVPLRIGDKVELTCEIPRGFQASAFLLDTAGNLQELTPLQTNPVGDLDRIRFPAAGVWQVEKPAGTALFLVCANRQTRPRLEDIKQMIEKSGKPAPLPVPAELFLFLLNRDEVLSQGEEPREVVVTPFSQLRDRLERLRELASRHFDYIWGVALPVR
jgi:predicted Ser/Thr protein kinase